MDTADYVEPAQQLLADVRTFVAGASKTADNVSPELVKIGLSLINSLPAARDAVLEYFGVVFHSMGIKQVVSLTKKQDGEKQEKSKKSPLIRRIHEALNNFISQDPQTWAPVISAWSLDLLGRISAHNANVQKNYNLNDRLRFWMSCQATRTLIEINTQCLQCLAHSNTDSCVSILLDKSVSYAPHFDWVVAHVGSCFPQTVINKVLYCGLKDFCTNEQNTKTAKLNSVVSILSHLANTHFSDIKTAFYNLFIWSVNECTAINEIDDKMITAQKIATIPFLLQMCNVSPILLKAISEKTLKELNTQLLIRLSQFAPDWWIYFNGDKKVLLDAVIHLLYNLDNDVYHVIKLLLDTACLEDTNLAHVATTAQEVFDTLLNELDLSLRVTDSVPPFIKSIPLQLSPFYSLLLTDNELQSSCITQLFAVLGGYNSNILSSCVAYLLKYGITELHFCSLINVIYGAKNVEFFGQAFLIALQHEITEEEESGNEEISDVTLWENTERLLKWELKYGGVYKPVLLGLMENIREVISRFCYYRYNVHVLNTIAAVVLNLLNSGHKPLTLNEILNCIEGSVRFFFFCINSKLDEDVKSRYLEMAQKLLTRLCITSPCARMWSLRLLVETVINPPVSSVFGATITPDPTIPLGCDHSLTKENIDKGHMLMSAHNPLSSLHAGVVGGGLRKMVIQPDLPAFEINQNVQHFINVLRCCCLVDPNQSQISIDAAFNLALLLVQIISPDVMFNGLPWPEEDFGRVTVERDLCIRHRFDTTPILWSVLKFLAVQRPSLCYCSVLLRGVMATLLFQWRSCHGSELQKNKGELIRTTTSLLELMSLGQLLPYPLDVIQEVIPHLSPNEVVLILRECVWNYMRDHVPAPALFVRDGNNSMWRDPATTVPSKQYTETLRIVMLNNIGKLGSLYHKLFANNQKGSE